MLLYSALDPGKVAITSSVFLLPSVAAVELCWVVTSRVEAHRYMVNMILRVGPSGGLYVYLTTAASSVPHILLDIPMEEAVAPM